MGYTIATTSLDQFVPEKTLSMENYLPFIGSDRLDEIRRLAGSLEGASWTYVNSTFQGGGVAEMLRSVIPMARDLGIDARWFAIRGNDDFFKVTKKFHNMLQGREHPLSLEELFDDYLGTLEENAENTRIVSDMIVVHDPQPAAMIMKGAFFGHVLWRCHIDTSTPDPMLWNFLLPYINQYAGTIFTMPQYVGHGVQVPAFQIMPGIDPLTVKNRQYTDDEALEVLSPLFNQHNVDPGRPIIAAISRYDVHKNQETILKAFQALKKSQRMKAEPYLIFLGNTASDDPEGAAQLAQLEALAQGDPDMRFWVNVEDNDRVVGALMKRAEAMAHVSTREGFGLVVAEALWQGTPVIGSRVGGIGEQVIDNETGMLVDPMDVDGIASKMEDCLLDSEKAKLLGRQGREHVRQNFLLPEIVRRYLVLLRHYKGLDFQSPPFRINNFSHMEVAGRIITGQARQRTTASRKQVS